MIAHQLVGDAGLERWIAIAHGILGSGRNWRSFARELLERSGWGAVLLDLRMHGDSRDLSGPHTIDAAAGDVVDLVTALGDRGTAVAGLLGHSFGGKVITAAAARLDDLEVSWLVDSSPSARPEAMQSDAPAVAALAALESVVEADRTFATRDAFVDAIVAAGLSRPVGRWLAQNLERPDAGAATGLVFGLDLAAIRALLVDYFARDTWPDLAAIDNVHVAIAGRDSALSDDDQQRLAGLESSGALRCHRFEQAGHWIHIDARDALLDAVVASLG